MTSPDPPPCQPGPLVDSHAHLAEDRFDEDRDEVLRRAHDAGVELVVVIGYNVESSRRAIELAGSAQAGSVPALYATAGFAPHNVEEADDGAREQVRSMLGAPGVVAVGEIGLDYHYDMPRAAQRDVFVAQLGWALEHDLPVVIHSREAEQDVVAAIRDAGAGSGALRGVIHCFTESREMAESVLELGFYVSFSGILTFKNAADLRQTAAIVPLESMLIETDSPYLAPQVHRGKRNEPAFVGAVAQCVAEIHGVEAAQVARVTGDNCRALFRLEAGGSQASGAG